jgi:hypothetical protein
MDKIDELFLHPSAKHILPRHAFSESRSDSDFHLMDKRVAKLVVLLQQLHASTGWLGALPKAQLIEILSSAVRLCGFVNPLEVGDVMATILEAVETEDPIA